MTPIEIVKAVVSTLDKKLARDIEVLKIEDITAISDYFVICTGTSNTHVKTLKEELEFQLEQKGERVHHIEGHGGDSWVLLDYLSVVVHVFTEEARNFYSLDRVWGDAERISIDQFIEGEN